MDPAFLRGDAWFIRFIKGAQKKRVGLESMFNDSIFWRCYHLSKNLIPGPKRYLKEKSERPRSQGKAILKLEIGQTCYR